MSDDMTILDALASALAECTKHGPDEVPPACILWPDKAGVWLPFIAPLGERLPLYALGDYAPAERRGPAIWLRCVVAGTISAAGAVPEGTPVLYLPGVAAEELTNAPHAPESLEPLIELVYRGRLWVQKGGQDWTLEAFLCHPDGLDIETAGEGIAETLCLVRSELAGKLVSELRAQAPLTKSKLERLMLGSDFVGDILRWMGNPAWKNTRSHEQWAVFCSRCQDELAFDPDTDGALVAAEGLGSRSGAWAEVWRRFEEAPTAFDGIPSLLRQVRPPGPVWEDATTWPQDNEAAEKALRTALSALSVTMTDKATAEVMALDGVHAPRRASVWAKLGQAPLAMALRPLAHLAQNVQVPLHGNTVTDLASSWITAGWKTDAAVLKALAVVSHPGDVAAVQASIRALYKPWLQKLVERFQDAAKTSIPEAPSGFQAPDGTCLLFTDGLRWDAAQCLVSALTEEGLLTDMKWVLGPLPGVTSTAKPRISPAASLLGPGSGLGTRVLSTGSTVTAPVLRYQMASLGYQVLAEGETGDPAGKGWTECGNLDSHGHMEGWKIAYRVEEVVNSLRHRIRALLDAGWKDVRVMTDHGWLLMPGGLPTCETLHLHLTEVRKYRCARMDPTAREYKPSVPWVWDASVAIALAPGITCFEAGKEYEHGGLSPQECILPFLTVSAGAVEATVSIREVKWQRMRCIVEVDGMVPGLVADLRTKPADPTTSIVLPKPLSPDGRASLPVADDTLEGDPVSVVILGPDGDVKAKTATSVGGG